MKNYILWYQHLNREQNVLRTQNKTQLQNDIFEYLLNNKKIIMLDIKDNIQHLMDNKERYNGVYSLDFEIAFTDAVMRIIYDLLLNQFPNITIEDLMVIIPEDIIRRYNSLSDYLNKNKY